VLVSVIIRTYNEAQYLGELLLGVATQERQGFTVETIVVDSGSTDGTLEIAKAHDARVVHIKKSDFTFGRSLNVGCRAAEGEIFVLVSGHCVPANENWLNELISPLREGLAVCSYGRQLGRDTTKFSESELFEKYFPAYSKIPQEGFFCNNANAAVARSAWERHQYNEALTGLEDMYLAQQLCQNGLKVAYVASASVFHIHNEGWQQVKVRYEREAIALQQILPSIHFNFLDFLRYFIAAVLSDSSSALTKKILFGEFKNIVLFRFMQYWGTYRGAQKHLRLSEAMKRHYFYPKDVEKSRYVP
jgi:glycosyltransferase involved in cell wall biosynthesis